MTQLAADIAAKGDRILILSSPVPTGLTLSRFDQI